MNLNVYPGLGRRRNAISGFVIWLVVMVAAILVALAVVIPTWIALAVTRYAHRPTHDRLVKLLARWAN